jgi:hypothetical protein
MMGSKQAMHRDQLPSTSLKSVGYDGEQEILEVEFCNGEIHQYLNVPPEDYADLIASESQGSYFTNHIRGMYEYREVGTTRALQPTQSSAKK